MLTLFKKTPSISVSQLQEKLRSTVHLLDVRSSAEYRGGHILQAENLPLERVERFSAKTTEPIYVICQSGMRSKKAVAILRKKGIDAVNVRGGMNAWQGPVRGGK